MPSPTRVKLKRFDTTLPAPSYKSPGAAALDLYARQTVVIEPHTVGYVPLNIALEPPKQCWVLLTARSSLHKKGLLLANGVGVGDSDYSGDDDEYQAALLNFTDSPVVVERGERIVQFQLMKKVAMQLVEVEQMNNSNRGGFGSTGKYI
ncbi:dUTP diphosphatase [Candidatus Woesebacteria bacterium]|nr:dUTP diphosphatase [Candidatus Woesebacteria bacterium]